MLPETVITWMWKAPPNYRSSFGAHQVNTLQRMVKRNYAHPHRFVCVTHETNGLDASVEVVKPWDDFKDLLNPHGGRNPSCYRRLRAFHPDIASTFGARFVSLDLDCVITADLMPLWDRPEDFVIWGDTNPKTAYNGSMFLLSAGARRQVWERFDPQRSPSLSYQAGCFGSDQGWISYCLGPNEVRWTKADGVYSYRNELMNKPEFIREPPENARAVFFHGPGDPWQAQIQNKHRWVRRHYC